MSLLLPSRPIVVIPELAMRVGLNEAMLLQQVHYWVTETTSGIEHDGRRWVYNTIAEWMEQFPFLSESSIKRAFASLKAQGVIYVEKLSNDPRDKTNFYAINYAHRVLSHEVNLTPCNGSNCTDAAGQNEPVQKVKMTRCNGPKRAVLHTEITTEKKEPPLTPPPVDNSGADKNQTAGEVFCFLNSLTGAKTRPDQQALRAILERLADGYSQTELELVAEHRTDQLLNNPTLAHMLAPNLLFAAKTFGSYLVAANAWQKKRTRQAARAESVEKQCQSPPVGDVPGIDFEGSFERLFVEGLPPESLAEKLAWEHVQKYGFGSSEDEDAARLGWRVILSKKSAVAGRIEA
ncbi:conserved phage C-terminal domain-containing protein [Serratia marcescens]|uniref:conserved phage C-terminal domain-containing protein n=1 Tax=Serratia marcescens TaxID=615 RepID=UPI00148DDEF2|nr:conserved phage C-terminal domain-containing protein [Serratia marcescens]QJU39040.1 transcriptional regulator [Serratia marcescens]